MSKATAELKKYADLLNDVRYLRKLLWDVSPFLGDYACPPGIKDEVSALFWDEDGEALDVEEHMS